MGTSQSGAQAIRYNRSLLNKRNSFKEVNKIIINENNNHKIEGLSKSENRKIRLALDKERLASDRGVILAYSITGLIGIPMIYLTIKVIEILLF